MELAITLSHLQYLHLKIFLQTLNFLFCMGVYPINNVVVVSDKEQQESVIHIPVFLLPYELTYKTERDSQP